MVQKDHTCDISISFDCRSDCALLALWRIASKWTTQTHGDTALIQSQTTWDQGIINVRFVSRSALESNLFLCSYSTNLPPKITPVKIHFFFFWAELCLDVLKCPYDAGLWLQRHGRLKELRPTYNTSDVWDIHLFWVHVTNVVLLCAKSGPRLDLRSYWSG